jgi:release factor glutamine methyltransferase
LTVAVVLDEAAGRLAAAGIVTARLDAELLLRHVLGWTRADLIARDREAVPEPALALFREALEQRARRRPLQHLTGVQSFWRHDFIVTPDVLVPRPETEMLVETVLELLSDLASPVVVDVGTGSGCIVLSIAAERPDARLHAVDVSPAALEVARGNASRLGLGERVVFHQGDLLEPVRGLAGTVDLVVSNPPYVRAEEWARLEPEVRTHDPKVALVPPEGVDRLYARLFEQAVAVLRPGGWIGVEVGAGGDGAARESMARAGLVDAAVRPDLAGTGRVVIARRPATT